MKRTLALVLLAVLITCQSITQGSTPVISLELTFNHAARDGLWEQDSNKFSVVFNGKVVKTFVPQDYLVHCAKFILQGRVGKNSLHFIGEGRADSYGSQVDNIRLLRKSASGVKNYIENGDFEEGHSLGYDNTQWLIFKDGEFKGWRSIGDMEVGYGLIYNQNWPCDTHVCELDGVTGNSDIYQSFDIEA